jgi:hypothetical protein
MLPFLTQASQRSLIARSGGESEAPVVSEVRPPQLPQLALA